MIRQLYIFILLAHPATFKYRFGLEMLAIYEETAKQGSTIPLLADGLRSLVRQWVHPYQPAPVAVAGGSAPIFQTLDNSIPRRHLMTGAAFTLMLFSLLATSISLGGRSVGAMFRPLLVRPHVVGALEDVATPTQYPGEIAAVAPNTEVTVTPRHGLRIFARITRFSILYPLFGFRVLDRNGDTMLFDWEMALAPAMLRTLDRDGDGSLGRGETYLMLAVLDHDRDGIISSAEISNSTIVLRGLDADQDRVLVIEEVIAAVLAAR